MWGLLQTTNITDLTIVQPILKENQKENEKTTSTFLVIFGFESNRIGGERSNSDSALWSKADYSCFRSQPNHIWPLSFLVKFGNPLSLFMRDFILKISITWSFFIFCYWYYYDWAFIFNWMLWRICGWFDWCR